MNKKHKGRKHLKMRNAQRVWILYGAVLTLKFLNADE